MHRRIVLTIIVVGLMSQPTWGQDARGPTTDPLVLHGPHPETMADVILVLEPHDTFPLNVMTSAEQVIRGSILRVERGAMPLQIVNTPNTIVDRLHPGVPVRLYLKAFKDRNAHYIIGVFPLPEGGKP